MCVVYARLQYVWFYANWARTLPLPPPPSQALYLTGQNKLAGWMTGWLACWLVGWLVGPLGCYCTMPIAWIMHIDLWSPLTDSPKHSAQLNSTELNWAELNSSQVKSNRVKSTVPVAKCRRRLHRRRCCRRFKPTFIFFSLALLTVNKKRKCKRRKPNSIELKTENN